MNMQTLIQFLGFTTLASSIWNVVAYIAFIGIIIGVSLEKYRNWFITIGALVLVFYAGIFLHDPLFTILQSMIVFSGFLELTKTPKRLATKSLILAVLLLYAILLKNGVIADMWSFIGSLGLLGIAFGLIILPKRFGFLVMAMGGAFLTIYAYTVSAWVFFLLNIFFARANVKKWYKNKIKRAPKVTLFFQQNGKTKSIEISPATHEQFRLYCWNINTSLQGGVNLVYQYFGDISEKLIISYLNVAMPNKILRRLFP